MNIPATTRPANLTGRVHRLGGEILLDEGTSWCPPGVRRREPVSAYLIKGDHGAVLVDTGIRLHEAEILAQLDELLETDEPLSIVLTRTEMECCLNIPAIEEHRRIDTVWYTGGITVPRSTASVQRIAVEPGTWREVEVREGITLHFISPLLRLLPTLWVFDPASGALLTSDAFTHLAPPVEDTASADPMAGLHKFRWFGDADTHSIAADVRQIVRERSVAAIGPGYGWPVTGADACRREAELLAVCLEEVGAR